MKKILTGFCVVFAAFGTAVAHGAMPPMPTSAVLNMLKLPVDVDDGPRHPTITATPTFEDLPTNGCKALRIHSIIFDPVENKIRGATGGCVYPSWDEAVFAMSNQVMSAVREASGGKGMGTPFQGKGKYGEQLFWWKPTPDAKRTLELIVRAYRNGLGQVFVGTCLHVKGDDIKCDLNLPAE
ncbi:MAG: hypothetical protein IKQ17_05220 [Kiritimatiellae bacterium]|nr:hypothetical protein [Kiritimatiellia bacterium]